MTGRLPTGITVGALLRRANDAGGMAVVRARGDDLAGGVLVILVDRAGGDRVVERGIGSDGTTVLIDSTPNETVPPPDDSGCSMIDVYWRRRRQRDPDLWVIELDIPNAERFAAETLLVH